MKITTNLNGVLANNGYQMTRYGFGMQLNVQRAGGYSARDYQPRKPTPSATPEPTPTGTPDTTPTTPTTTPTAPPDTPDDSDDSDTPDTPGTPSEPANPGNTSGAWCKTSAGCKHYR